MKKLIPLLLLLNHSSWAETPELYLNSFYPAELVNGRYYGDDDCDFDCNANPFHSYYLSIHDKQIKLTINAYPATQNGDTIYSTQSAPQQTVIEANCQPVQAIMPPGHLSNLIAMECIDYASKTLIEWHIKDKDFNDKYAITLTVKSKQRFADIRMQKTGS